MAVRCEGLFLLPWDVVLTGRVHDSQPAGIRSSVAEQIEQISNSEQKCPEIGCIIFTREEVPLTKIVRQEGVVWGRRNQ